MRVDVVIVGAGLVGASLAAALRDADLTLALIEPRPPARARDPEQWDSRVYAISPGSTAFLEQCGIRSRLPAARVTQVEAMRVFGDDGRSCLEFDAYDAGLAELACTVESSALLRAAWEALLAIPNLKLFAGRTCTALETGAERVRLVLDDGTELEAGLVVGADGAESWVRQQAGIQAHAVPYHQMGVVANFAAALPHRGSAYQWFRRDSILAYLPLPDNRVSIVWSTTDAHAQRLLDLGAAQFAAEVAEGGHRVLGGLELLAPAQAFPLRLLRVRRLVASRIALAGDAAHNVHPLAGQGVNLGFRDARELAQVLARRGAQGDCGDYFQLRRYERARREDIAAMQFATDALKNLFNNDSALLAGLRNFGLRLTNRRGPLKNFLVRHAVS